MSEKKKLTDEQVIAKNAMTDNQYIERLEYCQYPMNCCICKYKNDCFLDNKKTVYLIHRLQENNANQVRMRCDMQKKFDDLQTLCTEQKAEIERLTEELDKEYALRLKHQFACEKKDLELKQLEFEKAELQKQVDELKKRLVKEKLHIECKAPAIKDCPIAKQAVKDTAKEIFNGIIENFVFAFIGASKDYEQGYTDALKDYDKQFRDFAKKEYGVEVDYEN